MDAGLAMMRRRCVGDPYGASLPNHGCIAPPTGFFVTLGFAGDVTTPATLVVACCDSHQSVVEDWLRSVSVSEGFYAPIEALDDPEVVATLLGDSGTLEYVSRSA